MRLYYVTLISLLSWGATAQDTYVGAVYEFYPTVPSANLQGEDLMLQNINRYRSTVETAHVQKTDIIVFPEYGITSMNVDPDTYAIEITSTNPPFSNKILYELSDIARGHSMYLVVNLLEKERSSNNKTYYYNSNLVFDRSGKIIKTYRKINLNDEPNLTAGTEVGTFSTDFGVTFGIVTGFDMLFPNPSKTVLNVESVTDVVYPTAWYNTLPFYSALGTQHGYVKANKVNLLAANYNNASEGIAGSGIYLANGQITETQIGVISGASKLIVQTVTKVSKRSDPVDCQEVSPFKSTSRPDIAARGLGSNRPDINNFFAPRRFESNLYKFQDVDLAQSRHSTKICHNSFCCSFNFTIQDPNESEYYKLIAYDGPAHVDPSRNQQTHIRVCTLLSCNNTRSESCGARINGTTRFTEFSVGGNFSLTNETFYQPLTLNINLQPIEGTAYCISPSNDGSHVFVQLIKTDSVNQLLQFGILGRSSASVDSIQFWLLLCVALVTLLTYQH